jgi:hypothetical protein
LFLGILIGNDCFPLPVLSNSECGIKKDYRLEVKGLRPLPEDSDLKGVRF